MVVLPYQSFVLSPTCSWWWAEPGPGQEEGEQQAATNPWSFMGVASRLFSPLQLLPMLFWHCVAHPCAGPWLHPCVRAEEEIQGASSGGCHSQCLHLWSMRQVAWGSMFMLVLVHMEGMW